MGRDTLDGFALLDANPAAVVVLDRYLRCVHLNPAAIRLGAESEYTDGAVIPALGTDDYRVWLRSAVESPGGVPSRLVVHARSGQLFEVSAVWIGELLVIYHLDVTATRRGAIDLRNAEQRRLDLLESLPLIVYSVEPIPPYEPVYINRGVEILGYTRDEWLAERDRWVQLLHPDDRDWVLRDTNAALTAGKPVEYEYRMLARDGSVHWFHDRGQFVRDSHGRVLEWRGIMMDITARVTAEQALRESEERYRRLVESREDPPRHH